MTSFALLSAKHVLADFYWQPEWMVVGKERATQWAPPLLAHCLIHGCATTLLLVVLEPQLWFLGTVDAVIHLLIDRCKGIVTTRFRLTPNDRPFWAVLGIDQTCHHLTSFVLAIVIAFYG